MGMTDVPNIVEFTTDPQLLGLSLSPAQETLQRAIYGLPLAPDQLEIFRACTGRATAPVRPSPETTVITGARGGKDSRIGAPIIVYEAVFGGHEQYLGKGERGVLPLVAQDQRATQIAFGYIRDYLTGSAHLRELLASEPTATRIDLVTGISILCFPCTLRALRGFSIPGGAMSELAFYRLEGAADADVEIQASIRRGMLAFPNTKLIKISTPYTKGGVLFDDFTRAFGKDDADLLVWRASSQLMNPTLSAARLERERRLDPIRAAREYDAEFIDDLMACFEHATLMACVSPGVRERPPAGLSYYGFLDAASGERKGNDAFTFSVSHFEDERAVLDVCRAWQPPFSPSGVISEIAALARTYGLSTIGGDRYAPGFVSELIRNEGLTYAPSELDRSRIYLELLPAVNSGRVVLLDIPELLREFRGLERRRGTSGRDRVDHGVGAHDDRCNSAAGSLVAALGTSADGFGFLEYARQQVESAKADDVSATTPGKVTVHGGPETPAPAEPADANPWLSGAMFDR